MVQAHAAMVGGAGVETELSCRNVLSDAQVIRYCVSTCRQRHLPTSRSKRQLAWCCLGGWPVLGQGVRTGGRLHPGLAGVRLLKTTPDRWLPREFGHCRLHRGGLLHCAQLRPGFLCCYITCRQPRLTASRSKRQLAMPFRRCQGFMKVTASGRVDVYTQGQQGSDC